MKSLHKLLFFIGISIVADTSLSANSLQWLFSWLNKKNLAIYNIAAYQEFAKRFPQGAEKFTLSPEEADNHPYISRSMMSWSTSEIPESEQLYNTLRMKVCLKKLNVNVKDVKVQDVFVFTLEDNKTIATANAHEGYTLGEKRELSQSQLEELTKIVEQTGFKNDYQCLLRPEKENVVVINSRLFNDDFPFTNKEDAVKDLFRSLNNTDKKFHSGYNSGYKLSPEGAEWLKQHIIDLVKECQTHDCSIVPLPENRGLEK